MTAPLTPAARRSLGGGRTPDGAGVGRTPDGDGVGRTPGAGAGVRSAPLTALALVSLLLALGVFATRWDQSQPLPAPAKEAEPLTSRAARRLRDGERLGLNTASEVELQLLPGIGPALSARIIAGRPFQRVEDLQRVPGIGARTVERLRPFLDAQQPDSEPE